MKFVVGGMLRRDFDKGLRVEPTRQQPMCSSAVADA